MEANKNIQKENLFDESYFGFQLTEKSDSCLKFEITSLFNKELVKLVMRIASVVLLPPVILYIAKGMPIKWLLIMLGSGVVLFPFSLSFKPFEIIAEKGIITIIYKRLFLIKSENNYWLNEIESVQAKTNKSKKGASWPYYAIVILRLKSGAKRNLYTDIRSSQDEAVEDSKKLAAMIAEKIGVPFEYADYEK